MRNFSQWNVVGHAKCEALISSVVRSDMAATHTKGSAEYSVYKTMMAIRPPCLNQRVIESTGKGGVEVEADI
jgi:hypothetical protein